MEEGWLEGDALFAALTVKPDFMATGDEIKFKPCNTNCGSNCHAGMKEGIAYYFNAEEARPAWWPNGKGLVVGHAGGHFLTTNNIAAWRRPKKV